MRMAMGDKGMCMVFAVYYGTRHYVSLSGRGERKQSLFLFQIAHMCNRIFISIIMYTALNPFLKSFISTHFGTVGKERTSFIVN